jgi:hypothetical protein
MNWIITLCLAAAGICAVLFMVILYKIFSEISARRPKPLPIVPARSEPSFHGEEDRTAALLLRHSFVITMMEQYQATGASGDVIEFINRELCTRDAGWRVRVLPDGSGEFYDLQPPDKGLSNILAAKARVAAGR